MVTCEGIVPEKAVLRPAKEGEKPTHVEQGVGHVAVIVPAHPCDQPATMLARSIRAETQPGVHGTVWKIEADHHFCAACFMPGTVTQLDGTVTTHAAMALEDA